MSSRRSAEPLDTREKALEHGWRSTTTHVAEAVRTLANQAPGETFLREHYPHEPEFVTFGMHLTAERCREAITFLQTVVEHMETECTTCGRTGAIR